MQIVRNFVRLHPDRAGADKIHRTVQVFRAQSAQRRAEYPLCLREKPGPELPGATHHVFPKAGLAFVNPESRSLPEWLPPEPLLGQTLLVKPVPGFVQNGSYGIQKIVLTVPGGNSRVSRSDPLTERMRGNIQPPSAEIEADSFGQPEAKSLLLAYREAKAVDRVSRWGGCVADLGSQCNQPGT